MRDAFTAAQSSSALRERIGFYRPVKTDDGFGNKQVGFAQAPELIVRGSIAPRLGGESVLAGRLEGRALVNIMVRASAATRAISTDWKARDQRSGVDYNIRSIIDPFRAGVGSGRWLEILAEEGVAQ